MNLRNWLSADWVTKRETSPQEIADLLGVADRDLSDCQSSGLSPDWRMNIAYNAALQVATAALAAAGYRAARDSHHYRVIQSLTHTICADANLIGQFDQFRKKRNVGGYERAGLVSDQEADEMFDLAKQLRKDVEKWIRDNHPDLLQ
jgi:hypothetical protein